ncbi:hypothetical protein ACS0TY_009333 [Phlomoides rotata]
MINLMESVGEQMEKCLDPNLWHACAGGMTQIPPVNSKVFYFPQGHAEHAPVKIDFLRFPRIPPLVPCRVESIKYLADARDEVYAKIRLVPLGFEEWDGGVDDDEGEPVGFKKNEEKSFAKTLTPSDANNGGGFSVPRYCAEMIFPRLDLKAEPPVQTILVKDVHGVEWKFRHIYRGTPRRHLLTTGWSNFVNRKSLYAGNSIVFSRAENGDLCIGIRRSKRGFGGALERSSSGGWNMRGIFGTRNLNRNGTGGGSDSGMKERGENVLDAVNLAVSGQPFEVLYYPLARTPEFVVRASAVRDAMRVQWCTGLRFRMAFETEDSSPISWFTGTVSNVQVDDPDHWPDSPWRLLQVAWDEPDLLQNMKRVNPWQVEIVPSIPTIHHFPFSPPSKRPRFSQSSGFPIGQIPMPTLLSNTLSPSSPFCFFDNISAGIQGARHAQYVLPSPDFNFNHQQMGLGPFDYATQLRALENSNLDAAPLEEEEKKDDEKAPAFYLFGIPIHTEEQLSESCSSDGNQENVANASNGSGSAVIQNSPAEASSDGNN